MKLSALVFFLGSCLFAQQTITLNAPPPPSASSVSAQASRPGLGNYCWWVVATYPIGDAPPSTPACLTGVGGTVTIRWASAGAGVTYAVLRTDGQSLPSGTANIAVATGISGTSQTDTFSALSSYTISGAGPATANIRLDNIDYASPGLYQNVNNGPYTPLGSGGGGSGAAYHSVPFSSSPAFAATSNTIDIFNITLTGAVTSSSISGMSTGQYVTIAWCQDAIGGHPAVWPVTFQNAGTIDGTPNGCSVQTFFFDGGNFQAQGPLTVVNLPGDAIVLAAAGSGSGKIQPAATMAAGSIATMVSGASNTVVGIANPSDSNCVSYIDVNGVQQRVACGGGGGTYNPVDARYVTYADEFGCGVQTTGSVGCLGWQSNQLGANGAVSIANGQYPNLGLLHMTGTTAANNGWAISLGTPATPNDTFGGLGSRSGWQSLIVARIGSTSQGGIRMGFANQCNSASLATGFFLRAITGTDTDYQFEVRVSGTSTLVDSGVAIDTNFHTFYITATAAGTVSMQLDGGTAKTFCASGGGCTASVTLPTNDMDACLSVWTTSTSSTSADVDRFSYYEAVSSNQYKRN